MQEHSFPIAAGQPHETPLGRDKEKPDILSGFARHVDRTSLLEIALSDCRQRGRLTVEVPFPYQSVRSRFSMSYPFAFALP
jgi:hypothetical protein